MSDIESYKSEGTESYASLYFEDGEDVSFGETRSRITSATSFTSVDHVATEVIRDFLSPNGVLLQPAPPEEHVYENLKPLRWWQRLIVWCRKM